LATTGHAMRRPDDNPPLHIVVTCTNRKRYAAAPPLHLGSLTHGRLAARFTAWTARIGGATDPRHRALDLYAGEHWQVVRSLTNEQVLPVSAALWVVSAGYGLIPVEAAICSYGATFSAGRDTVGVTVAEVAEWWRLLGDWPDPVPGHPRSVTELARRFPGATIVAVLSEAYQRACADDLLTAAAIVRPDAMSVVGPPDVHPQLADLLVPVTAPLQHTVGGSLQALNVRVLRHLIADGAGTDRTALREAVQAATPTNPPTRRPAGQRMSDAEVCAYIRAHPNDSATRLLRQLRSSGLSCEQARFGRLHTEIRQGYRS
jgi:hypothetical protein